jgi:hypothetical protein
MAIQGAQPDGAALTTDRRRFRKLVAIAAGTALVFTLAAAGVYRAASRSQPATASWTPSVSPVNSADELARQAKARADRQTAVAAEAEAFIGIWNSHGGQLVVKADRSATLSYRVYVWCNDGATPPCDQRRGNLIISGGQVDMHIVQVITASGMAKATAVVDTSSDPRIRSGSRRSFELSGGIITWSSSSQPFCNARASQASACGA